MNIRTLPLLLLAGSLAGALAAGGDTPDGNWPSFRGPQARGVAPGPAPPATWDGTTGVNVRWKTPIPGLGHSGPVIWGRRLFVTTAVGEGDEAELVIGLYGAPFSADDDGVQSWRLYCLDKASGEVLWQKSAAEGVPKARRHTKSSHANPTPATDGERVVAFFGSEGLYCYDMEGELRWKKDLGLLRAGPYRSPEFGWGFATSPVLYDGKVIVQADTVDDSFLAVLDAADGRELWRVARDENATWSTPTVHQGGGRTQILVNGYKHMGGYDLATGRELWQLTGGGDVPVPTPFVAHGLVFLTNAHGGKSPIYAVRTDASGDITLEGDATANAHIAWSIPRGGAYMPTPLVLGDELYVSRDRGTLSVFDARSGEQHYQERLTSGAFTSSGVAAGERLYFTNEDGQTHVVQAGKTFEKLAVNELGEIVMSSPAISDGTLFFRGRRHVVAIAEGGGAARAAAVPDLGSRTAGSDWPRFLGPTGDARSTETGLSLQWADGAPPIRWHKKVGEGYATASIAKGRLFFFDRSGDTVRITASRSETGEELWRSEVPTDYEDYYDYSGGPRATPRVDGERVYFFDVEGRLRCHRAVDGELLWEVDTAAEFGVVKNFFGAGATPVVEGGLLIAQVGGSPPGSPKIHSGEVQGNGSGIVAFDKRTGEVRYRITDELASYSSPQLATIDGRRWGFVFTRGGLVGFEPTKGTVDFFYPWRSKVLESVNAADPVVVGNKVFITETYGPGSSLLEARPGGYEVVWKDPPRGKAMQSHWCTPIHHQGVLYGSSGRSPGDAELRAVELATGKVLWSEPGLTRSSLLYVDGHFLVLTEYGRLLVVEATPQRYHLVSELDLGRGDTPGDPKAPVDDAAADKPLLRHPAWNAPVLSHGLLYLRGKDQLICLDLAPGA